MNKKIKIFLGGFINYTNAQNLNCLALAKNLDKKKFSVYTLELFSGNLESQKNRLDGVKVFNCFYPLRISAYLGFLWGIWNCDIAYLPKGEFWKFNRFLLQLFNKKSFSTVEGIWDNSNLESVILQMGSYDNLINSKKIFTKLYAITSFLGKYNQEHHKITFDSTVLYLGSDTETFKNTVLKKKVLKKVIYIGRLKKRKGIYDFLDISRSFPELDFEIFGNGEEKENIEKYISENQLSNVKLKGVVNHEILADNMKKADLHILPSRSEGFPKVTLETAAAGVPSIVYGDYGAQEWIADGINGWVVDTLDEMRSIIEDIRDHPQKLEEVSKNAVKLAESFDWTLKIKDWEKEIVNIVEK